MSRMKRTHLQEHPDPPEEIISQETVDAMIGTSTMEEFLLIAEQHGVDWDSLPDEWLSAIAEGDISALLPRGSRHKNRHE